MHCGKFVIWLSALTMIVCVRAKNASFCYGSWTAELYKSCLVCKIQCVFCASLFSIYFNDWSCKHVGDVIVISHDLSHREIPQE